MSLTDNPLALFAAMLLGVALQPVPGFLRRRGKRRAAAIIRPLVLGYWLALGILMISNGVTQISNAGLPAGISSLALGLGMMLIGLGQALGLRWLAVAGVIVMAVGPLVTGIRLIQNSNALGGLIALALGLGILISAVRGWPGGIGRMAVGTVLLGSGVMLILDTLMAGTSSPDLTSIAIGVFLLILSLWGLIGGAMTLIRSIKQPPQVAESQALPDN